MLSSPRSSSSRRPRRTRRTRRALSVRAAAVGLALGALLAGPVTGGAARADVLYVPWSKYLPGWTDAYVPTSPNDCVAGRDACVKQTTHELNRVLQETGKSCSHHAVFALAYTRITQSFAWSGDEPGFYEDVPFANHQSAVFAKFYTDAWTNWQKGRRAAVPKAWLTAFDMAAAGKLKGTGDLLLGMNAHINRDLPYVLASVGLAAEDGTPRKPDFDKVEKVLAAATKPLIAEAAQRFDPSMDDSADPFDATYSLMLQLVTIDRQKAWRNAEALVSAPTPEARALVEARIESEAQANAEALILATSYLPPLSSSTGRNAHCAAHHDDPAPLPYPFGTASPYRA